MVLGSTNPPVLRTAMTLVLVYLHPAASRHDKIVFQKLPCIPEEDLSGDRWEIYIQVQGVQLCPPGRERVLLGSQKYILLLSLQESSWSAAVRLRSTEGLN